MEGNSLDPDVVPDAEPDAPTLDAEGDVRRTDEHSGKLRCAEELPRQIKILLPPELKQKHADVLIVCATGDRLVAMQLQQAVNTMKFVEAGEAIPARAFLHDDATMCAWINSKVDWLEYALKYSTLTCVLFTKEFSRDAELMQIAKASFWASVTQHGRQNNFIPVYLTDTRSEDFPDTLSPFFQQLKPLNMYSDGWEDRIRAKIWDCLISRLEREENQRREQIDYIQIRQPELLPADVSSGLSANSDTGTQTNENYQATGSHVLAASDTQPQYDQYDHDSEQNLDVHANDQYSTNIDDVDAVSRLEPDGSCDAEAATAAAAAAAGCSAVNPARAAADSAATSQPIDITEVILFAATFGIIFLTFFH